MFIQSMLLKMGSLLGPLGAGEVEKERSFDNGHFNGPQLLIGIDECGDSVPGDVVNILIEKNSVYFQLTMESLGAIKEFDRRQPVGAQDKSVLSRPQA